MAVKRADLGRFSHMLWTPVPGAALQMAPSAPVRTCRQRLRLGRFGQSAAKAKDFKAQSRPRSWLLLLAWHRLYQALEGTLLSQPRWIASTGGFHRNQVLRRRREDFWGWAGWSGRATVTLEASYRRFLWPKACNLTTKWSKNRRKTTTYHRWSIAHRNPCALSPRSPRCCPKAS